MCWRASASPGTDGAAELRRPKADQSRDEAMLQTIALSVDLIMIESSPMKQLPFFVLLASAFFLFLLGCSSGPSPEQQVRDADQQKDAEQQQAEFRKGLPPVANPGRGW